MQPQPHARITRRERTAAGRQPARVGARLEKAARERGRGEGGGETAVRSERLSRHQARLGEEVGEVESFDAHTEVEVAGDRLPGELELVGVAADLVAAAGYVRAAAGQVHGAGLHCATDRLRVKLARREDNLGANDCVRSAGAIKDVADGQGVSVGEHQRRGTEDDRLSVSAQFHAEHGAAAGQRVVLQGSD